MLTAGRSAKTRKQQCEGNVVGVRAISFLFVIAAAVVAARASSAEPIKIRVAYVVPVADWAPMIAAKRDLAKYWGTSYVFEAVHFPGTPSMITALANNELEIADLAYATIGLAIENADIDDLRVVADEFQDGVPGYFSSQFRGGEGSGINKIEDLKSKVLAVNAIGGGLDIAMKAALKKHGLIDKRDYTVIEAPFPAMASMLREKKVDLASAVMPFALNPIFTRDGKVLFNQTDGIGRSDFSTWTVRKSFVDKHRAALVDFMEDVIRIERWYLDPKNHDEVAKIASQMLKVPPERLGWLFTKQDNYRSPDAMPDLEALQSNIDTAAELGFLKSSFDVKKYSDLSIIEEATKRLK
jgi:NitT/TauT family transport system substrate-binding protein